jgi:hypothetical protein
VLRGEVVRIELLAVNVLSGPVVVTVVVVGVKVVVVPEPGAVELLAELVRAGQTSVLLTDVERIVPVAVEV